MHARLEMFLVALLLLIVAGCDRTGSAVVTPGAGSAEAVALAPELRAGMSEKKAKRILNKHGIPCFMCLGCSHGWTCFGELTNRCSLALGFGAGRSHIFKAMVSISLNLRLAEGALNDGFVQCLDWGCHWRAASGFSC